MNKSSLELNQRRIVEIIEALGFGVIERLLIRGGLPCYEPEPRIVQSIKLDSEPERQTELGDPDLTLRKEFEGLFDQLARFRDGVVDIEVKHGAPFRLIVKRSCREMLT